MMQKIAFFLLLIGLWACNSNTPNSNDPTLAIDAAALLHRIKYHPGDPFIETLKESEFFKISGLKDNIVETQNGTILSIPKGAFRDKNGAIVEQEITIELATIESIEEQIQSNISSYYEKGLLQNGTTLYFNATQDGEALFLNEKNPIYMETPLNSDLKNPLVFEGVRNEQGEMQWLNPQKPKRHLISVSLEELDFLPPGFELTAEINLPFKHYTTLTKKLLDSLYYSLAPFHKNAGSERARFMQYDEYTEGDSADINCLEIDPAAIEVIKGKKFASTFIATREFEQRLHFLHLYRTPDVLETYVKNLEKDLSLCDKMVANLLRYDRQREAQFLAFANENWGNVKNLPPAALQLGNFYNKQLESTRKKLIAVRKKHEAALKKKAEKAQKIEAEYRALLTKRMNYRFKKFGFEIKKMGWITVAELVEKLDKFEINIVVDQGEIYDRVHAYTVDKNINSIFAFTSNDNILFNKGYNNDPYLLFRKMQTAQAIAIAYKGDNAFYAMKEFQVTPIINIPLQLESIDKKALKKLLQRLDNGHKRFNKLQVDLAYQATFHKEKLRKEQLKKEQDFIHQLLSVTFVCSRPYDLTPN